jgi:hypothetical protein
LNRTDFKGKRIHDKEIAESIANECIVNHGRFMIFEQKAAGESLMEIIDI